ncbi:MAG TPA: electron transfer flavoprotein subunit beta/FixA family protein [Spirochaetota bacterium]|nr:electron transfer flavoprotein subunit beta/FixA family protein [Spirochaetota bacterium]HRZ25797.1 electron transfer flavoprotein subunit beta/FixA family protein [Spirochaetota bacterium]HSA13756.1 electron transfer flavoprotein subunit beta/FixA family protein [Spirochaetota bacterium]
MKILVCIKEIIDPESPLALSEDGAVVQDKNTSYRMNRYDEFALEEAVQIKERAPGTTVTAITVGQLRSSEMLRRALGKGADDAIHIVTGTRFLIPPKKTARLIADYARNKNFDLIFTGVMSEDGMYCQTGPMIASMLGIPFAVSVISEALDHLKGSVAVECEIEGGIRERAAVSLPCLLAVQSGINRPRYPSLSNVLRAKTQEITKIVARDHELSATGSPAGLLGYPPQPDRGVMLEGSREEKAEKLAAILHEKGFV